MEFSLENLGFSIDVSDQVDIHQPDVSRTSSGSSASSGDSTRHSCSRCHGRMSNLSLDRRMFCTKCRGSECDQSTRCDECLLWTSSSPPRSIAPDSDIDARLSAQLITVNKTIDDKISGMSSSLTSQFSEMLASFRSSLPNSSFSVDPVVPGQLVSQPLLEKIVSQLKEDSLIASSVLLSNLSKAAGRGRTGSSSGDRYSSPLEQSHPGPSGYRKRSAPPARGSFAKHGHRGRGMSPSNRGKGFRK